MAKQTFTTGQVLTAAQMTSLQQTAMGGGSATAKTTSYVLVAADAGGTVAMNAAGATTITVNTALFAAGDTILIQNLGAGTCTVTAGTATVNTAGSLALVQYESGILYFTATSAAIFNDYVQAGGGGGGPAFSAYRSTNQSFSNSTWTKITFNLETFDTDADFASGTFTPSKAGYYQLNSSMRINGGSETYGIFYKNGNPLSSIFGYGISTVKDNGSVLVYANGTTDYFEVYGYGTGGTPNFGGDVDGIDTNFNGVWIRD